MHDCGHSDMQRGCGGCDPGAIEAVIDEHGTLRPFDPARDLRSYLRAGSGRAYIAPAGTPAPTGDPADDPNWKEIR
jgi:hypothetical protein